MFGKESCGDYSWIIRINVNDEGEVCKMYLGC